MPYTVQEWLNLAFRWTHVFAAIMWVGQTYFFTWLDHTFHHERQVWMVHSGGFYVVDKQGEPQLLDQTLHWFKWEAAFTWISGLLLFVLVYYLGGLMTADSPLHLSTAQAVALSLGAIAVGWVVYDQLWLSPIANNSTAAVVVSYLLLAGAIWGFTHVYGGRAAYMQTGAMLGSFMAWNVWLRILPAQRQLIAATKAGQPPDMRLAGRAKSRSKHNTFIVVPVVFMMLSNHFPVTTYGARCNWLVLDVLVLVGWGVAWIIRSR